MGALYQEPSTLLPDLKVSIHDTSIVFPAQETPRKSIFLSNIDQVLNFNVETLHFFPPHKDFPPHLVAEKLKNTLASALVPYDFLAGRLKENPTTGRLEIDCNGGGAVFVEACSEFSLDEIGDLVYPNPAFKELINGRQIVNELPGQGDDHPLCIFQVTSFKCGGFVMGISTNHATFDGLSFKTFLENIAALAADKPLAVIPCNDRNLLAARSPPRVTCDHPEMVELKFPLGQNSNVAMFDATPEELDFKIFKLTAANITSLKDRAKETCNIQNYKHITGFNVVSAHIWRCKALSFGENFNPERESRMLYAVDIRPRLVAPLPTSYTGNAVLSAYATAKCEELKVEPFSKLVEMVSQGAKRMTDEYARSLIDWGELYKGFPRGEFLVSSWWRLGFSKVEYPWGRPRYSCPVVCHRKDIILLFPDIEDDEKGVNVFVSLPKKEMDKFENLFNELISD
ncbi:fatty alcohol:caffeoyl-CoA acyltransferase-like [Mangifera indica]|uniref:fatty alcohol:caffeoyl-CoA acyltransferase-like n=1 Tax=Mangifera indica TaxID=29780 RepID=UPI001CF94290|nr:fatty alcohol:caffeoyl-CoA acyltransferase-like [Mangifera indica]